MVELTSESDRGVPMDGAVFDGARETDVGDARARRASTRRARSIVFDGRTSDTVRSHGDGRLHLHAQAAPSGGRKIHARSTGPTASSPSSRWVGGAVRRPAFGEMEVLGAPGLRRRLHPAGNADGEVRRRRRPHQGLRGDRQGRRHLRGRRPGSFNVLVKEIRRSASTSNCSRPRLDEATCRRRGLTIIAIALAAAPLAFGSGALPDPAAKDRLDPPKRN